jgi:transketolase
VTQLFPDNHVIDLHPWEHNEVAPVLAAAMSLDMPQPIMALHLTRPGIPIPDRQALGIPSHFEAARGAYVMRDYDASRAPQGCLIVQGTMSTFNTVRVLPEIEKAGLNVKIVAAISPQLFAAQPESYRMQVLTIADRIDSTVISNRSRRLAYDWLFNPLAGEYAMTSDHDDRWRTGGSVDEIIAEAHLSPEWILKGIERFVRERDRRLGRIRKALEAAGA